MFIPQTNRKIPLLMATQHPDNAGAPFWGNDSFIDEKEEVEEMYHNFFSLPCDEYMWDWEGKFADEAIIEKLIGKYQKQFQKKQIGRDIFITLRIPNIWEEKTFKLARTYMSVISGAELTQSIGLKSPPVFEFILPMTKNADQLIHIQETFRKTAQLHEKIFKSSKFGAGYIHIIPLFESIDDLADCMKILTDFIAQHQKIFKQKPAYLRPFIARSDPALNAGFIPAVLASRMALREIYSVSEKFNIPVYPIIGTGSLPFRGGINPENIKKTLQQYEGVKTITLQSAYRYDYPLQKVKESLKYARKKLKKEHRVSFNDEEFNRLRKINSIFRDTYCQTIEQAADLINEMALYVPRRRTRVQHIGLFGYNRGIGKTKLPRAISFTAAWYSLGIPPEFIATGRCLQKIKKTGLLPLLEKHFFTLRWELQHAGKYLNHENLELLSKKHNWAQDIHEDVKLCSQILKLEFGPHKDHHFIHRNLTSTILFKKSLGLNFDNELVEAAVMRKSLG